MTQKTTPKSESNGCTVAHDNIFSKLRRDIDIQLYLMQINLRSIRYTLQH
jgi:hypothetical protein